MAIVVLFYVFIMLSQETYVRITTLLRVVCPSHNKSHPQVSLHWVSIYNTPVYCRCPPLMISLYAKGYLLCSIHSVWNNLLPIMIHILCSKDSVLCTIWSRISPRWGHWVCYTLIKIFLHFLLSQHEDKTLFLLIFHSVRIKSIFWLIWNKV